jgi:hypothetical protein
MSNCIARSTGKLAASETAWLVFRASWGFDLLHAQSYTWVWSLCNLYTMLMPLSNYSMSNTRTDSHSAAVEETGADAKADTMRPVTAQTNS